MMGTRSAPDPRTSDPDASGAWSVADRVARILDVALEEAEAIVAAARAEAESIRHAALTGGPLPGEPDIDTRARVEPVTAQALRAAVWHLDEAIAATDDPDEA